LLLNAENVLEELLRRGSVDKSVLEKYIETFKYHCEWYEMLETSSAPELFRKDYEYLRKAYCRLLSVSITSNQDT